MKSILTLLFFLLMVTNIEATYSGPKRLSIIIDSGHSAQITIEADLQGRFDYVEYNQIDTYKNTISTPIIVNISEITNNQFTIFNSGLYELVFIKEDEDDDGETIKIINWRQKVYIPYEKPSISHELAREYLPIVVFHEKEEYFPQDLDDILSFNASSDAEIKISGVNPGLLNQFSYKMGDEIKNYLEFNGHSKSYFNFDTYNTTCDENLGVSDILLTPCTPLFLRDSKGSIDNATIYWDTSLENNSLFLTYYFFYAFDPKDGDSVNPGIAAHAFDRESFSIRFEMQDGEYKPQEVIYAGHLETQDLKYKGSVESKGDNILVEWSGGKTNISWTNSLKVGKHPVIYKAKGAHAIYPAMGYYGVDVKIGFKWFEESLIEEAGSLYNSQLLLPDAGQINLEELDLNKLKFLHFSGSWVDVLGSDNASFPAFIRTPYNSWNEYYNAPTNSKSLIEDFDSCLLIDYDYASNECQQVQNAFKELKGLDKYKAITIKVIDPETGDIVPNAAVKLVASDNSLYITKTTLEDGIYSFLFQPSDGINYLWSVVSSQGDINCGSNTFSSATLIQNNEEIYECFSSNNESPLFISPDTVSVNENQLAALTLVATDDTSAITYAIVDGEDSGSFTFNSQTGLVTFVSPPDFETKSSYIFTATATDEAGNVATQNVTITILDVDETIVDTTAPEFISSATVSVYENQTSVLTVLASDDLSSVTYSIGITDMSADDLSFTLDPISGVLTFVTAPDYETKSSYAIYIIATDQAGNSTTQYLVITILDVDEIVQTTIEHNGITYETVISPYTQRVWLDRNIGASQVCTALDDSACYGDYYQWGRNTDGHEKFTSATTTLQATDIYNAGSEFIIDDGTYSYDWAQVADSDGSLRSSNWLKTDGTSICPVGYRVPTIDELTAETTLSSDGISNNTDAFNNFLKLPSPNARTSSDGSTYFTDRGPDGFIWSSSVSGLYTYTLHFDSGYTFTNATPRASGNSVRCIEEYISSNIALAVEVNDLITGVVDYTNDLGEQLDIPLDMWVRVVPSVLQNDIDGWDGPLCKVESSGSFGNVCYVYDEVKVRDAFANSSEVYQVVVYKNHINTDEYNWDCGEDIYRYVGDGLDSSSWNNIVVTTAYYVVGDIDECTSVQAAPLLK